MNKELTISKTGIECLWERGGGYTSTGNAEIIANHKGGMKKALFVRKHGDLCNENHALIPVRKGDYIVTAELQWGVTTFKVEEIIDIDSERAVAQCEVVEKIPTYLFDAIEAAIDKCNDYHCRSVYYAYCD